MFPFFSYFIMFIGFICFFLYNYHFLITLISLELIVLMILYFVSVSLFSTGQTFGFFLFLVTSVCLGGYGISLLVSLSREFGYSFFLF